MAMPTMPVIRPPVLNEIRRGARLAKSLAGLTTLAAMLTDTVATPTPSSDTSATTARGAAGAMSGAVSPGGGVAEVSWARMNTGSQSLLGSTPRRIAWQALVMSTPMAENATIVV